MQSSKKFLLIGLAALAWCFGVIVLYFISHKPLTPGLAAALGLFIWRLIVALALVSLGGGIGSLLYRNEKTHPLARLALQAGLGLGALSLGVLIIGSTAGLPGWLLWLVLPAMLAVLFRQVRVLVAAVAQPGGFVAGREPFQPLGGSPVRAAAVVHTVSGAGAASCVRCSDLPPSTTERLPERWPGLLLTLDRDDRHASEY